MSGHAIWAAYQAVLRARSRVDASSKAAGYLDYAAAHLRNFIPAPPRRKTMDEAAIAAYAAERFEAECTLDAAFGRSGPDPLFAADDLGNLLSKTEAYNIMSDLDLHLVVAGTTNRPSAVQVGGELQVVSHAFPSANLSAVSLGVHVYVDPDAAPNTRTVLLRGGAAGTDTVTFTAETFGSQSLQIAAIQVV